MNHTTRHKVELTDEQIALLWERFPDDPKLIEFHCEEALYKIHVPIQKGRWPRYDVRVYIDSGFQGSGYLMVHWDDAWKVPNCLDNGYCTHPNFRHEEIVWDDQPERERLVSIQSTLSEWAYLT